MRNSGRRCVDFGKIKAVYVHLTVRKGVYILTFEDEYLRFVTNRKFFNFLSDEDYVYPRSTRERYLKDVFLRFFFYKQPLQTISFFTNNRNVHVLMLQ